MTSCLEFTGGWVSPDTPSFELTDAALENSLTSLTLASVLLNMRFAMARSMVLVSDSTAFLLSDLNMKEMFFIKRATANASKTRTEKNHIIG